MSSKRFNLKYFKKIPLGFILLLALFAGAIYLFTWLAHEVVREQEAWVDESVFNYLGAHVISPGLTTFMKGITFFASAKFLPFAYGAVFLVLILEKLYRRASEIFIIGAGGFLVIYFMKMWFHRVRPPDPLIGPLSNFSFPSGHATSGFVFYGLLIFLLWKTSMKNIYKYIIGIGLVSFALLIGFSRIYLRVHYTSDVVAGFCIGLAWMLLSVWVLERMKKKSGDEIVKEKGKAEG